MRIIFLDCDGVINILSPSYNTAYYRPDGSVVWFESSLIQRLNWLIEKTDANVVISSSWRLDMADLKVQMEVNGFKYWDKVVGETPYFGFRGDEIQEWLDNYQDLDPIETYVVLEDEIADVCGDKCMTISEEFVVEVDMKNGLTHQDVLKAKDILNRKEFGLI